MSARCPLPYERVRAGVARANELHLYREVVSDDPYAPTDRSREAVARYKAAKAVRVPLWAWPVRRWYVRRAMRRMAW